MHFRVIYIREAHAKDGPRPFRGIEVLEPKDFSQRLGVAKTCQADLGLKLPMLIDDMKNSTDAAYSAMPDRLFLIDRKGKIAYRGDRGPRGFLPSELEAAIKALLSPSKKALTPAERAAVLERLKARRRKALEKK